MHSAKDIKYWQLSNELEEGRNHVLRLVASNESLELILNELCYKAQAYNAEMLCSILRLDNNKKTLHPIASTSSLPESYCQALEGLAIGVGVGSCGTSAFLKKRVIVEDINIHPYWVQYKSLALNAGLQACWSEPIIGADGAVFGTFAMYYSTPQTPTEEDLKFIEVSANLAAVVFENDSNRNKLLTANAQLKQTVDERNIELEKLNASLQASIKENSKQYNLNINNEKMLTTTSLICGLSHEISTPVGTAMTATSVAEDKLEVLSEKVLKGNLSRVDFINTLSELKNTLDISKNSLIKASELLHRFKGVNTFDYSKGKVIFSMKTFLSEIKQALSPILGKHQLHIQCDNITVLSSKDIFWQIFFNLIENSIIHGFKELEFGVIQINVTESNNEICINYQDNGQGTLAVYSTKIFEPFFTSNRNKNSLGLGLNIINNLITHNLQGKIELIESPIGIRFNITFPMLNQQ